ncbi:MAG: alpha-L-fucosidase [Bryobacterales bacterium]|nr:alpha-L-fucosidase [Bryobacteraceae bacterium]MDW8130954.1 alpha-L-fucosidase [Bryobacterales bacterium]
MRLRHLIFLPALAVSLAAQAYRPSPENLKAREWFQDAKFGMFIHWGVYSVLGDGEWVMHNRKMTIAEYEKLASKFNPTEFDAAEWVALAREAGMRYITFTSKHHDGFAMWGTKQSRWNIVDATPYGRDVIKMLAEECRKQGIKLFLYHSHLDWHHPDYFPRGRTGQHSGRPESGNWYRYLDYLDAQLEELLTNYGPIGGIWFDGFWDKPDADWRLQKTYSLIHRLQPAALIGNNHHRRPFEGEDFQMFEKDLPGQNTSGFRAETAVSDLPLETCDTINRSWGYNAKDDRYKSVPELIRYLVRAAGYNANFLLNVGPTPSGKIQPEFVERLRGIGQWLRENGDSIYGTRGGPVPPRPWGVTTRKGSKVYVHVLDWPDEWLALPEIPGVRTARAFPAGTPVTLRRFEGSLLLRLTPQIRNPVDTIVVLE